MKVHVRLFAGLRDRFPREDRGRAHLELDDRASLQDLLDHLAIPDKLAQMVLIDGQQVPRDAPGRRAIQLEEDQVVSVFPPLAGG